MLSIHMKANVPWCLCSSEPINTPFIKRVSVWKSYGDVVPVSVSAPIPLKVRSTCPMNPSKFVMVDGSRPFG